MPQVQAQRRLVKSPPELWNELSDAEALARHLGEFGEIRITRVEPETKVVWEGEHANGSVEIESSGWGTKVILTADVEAPESEPESEPEPEPEPVPTESEEAPEPPRIAPMSVAAQRRGFLARFFTRDDHIDAAIAQARETIEEEPPAEPEPTPEAEPEPDTAPEPTADPDAGQPATANEQQILENVLDQLGQAHHRPFSRA